MDSTVTSEPQATLAPTGTLHQPIACPLAGKPVCLLGQPAAWLTVERHGDEIAVVPNGPMPRRCTIRPGALFRNDRGFPEANIVMGRLTFPNGSIEPVRYRAFTRDPRRNLDELLLPAEAMPDDDWITSPRRWMNHQGLAKRVLAAARVPWDGLSEIEIDQLVRFTSWPEPIEGCVLHALAQWTHRRGQCIVEIGSYRGTSATVLALALRSAASHSFIISVDPHVDEPHNREHVFLALRQVNESNRLVQFNCHSDQAARLLGRGVASMVFIDGDHSYAQVLADYENYREVLAPGGVLVFHDYDYSDHNAQPALHPGVRRVVDERVIRDPSFRPICLTHTLFAFLKLAE